MFTVASAFSLEREDAPLLRRLQWRALRKREKVKVGGRDIAGKQNYWPSVILTRPPLIYNWKKRDRQL